MYDVRPNTIIAFHGCDIDIRNKLVSNPNDIKISKKPFDWLGNGMYFWENNYQRAIEWAKNKEDKGEIKRAGVLGAVLQLGHCCDFLDSKFTNLVGLYYEPMSEHYRMSNKELPQNIDADHDVNKDQLVRLLDCAVIEYMHTSIEGKYHQDIIKTGYSNTKVFESTRGAFSEGGPAFNGAGIRKKSHIQICIRNMNCIKGFFIPREEVIFPYRLGDSIAS